MLFVGLLSPVIISILFGKKYAEAHAILSILAIGIPIRFIATSVGSLLVSGRNMRNKSYIMGVVAVINLGSNALLIPVYGLYGAAISTIFCEQIGRAHVCTPVTNAHLVCHLLIAKNNINNQHY